MKQRGTLNNYKRIIAGLLLLIVSAYYFNATMFYHQHTIGNKTIFHSHISSKQHSEPSSSGGHTSSQIELIAHLNSFSAEEQSFDSHIEIEERQIEQIITTPTTERLATFLGYSKSLRAPPVA